MPRKISKYKETKWKRIYEEDMQIIAEPGSLAMWTATLENNHYMIPTPLFIPKQLREKNMGYKYYVIDQWDLHLVHKMYEFEPEQSADYVTTLSSFVAHINKSYNTKKTMYLRAIKPLKQSSSEEWSEERDGECRVFAEEVFEVIQMIRMQQKEPLPKSDTSLSKLNKRWSNTKSYKECYATISLAELEATLDEFECDKSMVTIIDDPVQILSLQDSLTHGTPMKLMSYDTQWVLSAEQSVLHMTQALICGADWRRNTVKEKKMVVNRVIEPMSMKEGTYVMFDKITQVILELKKQLFENLYKDLKPTPRIQLQNGNPEKLIKTSIYTKCARDFGMKTYECFKDQWIPIYFMRVMFVIGWLDSMNAGKDSYNYTKLRMVITSAVMSWVPVDGRVLMLDYLHKSLHEKTPEEIEELERRQFLAENGNKESCDYCQQFEKILKDAEKELADDVKNHEDMVLLEKKVYGKREYVLTTNEDVKELRKELGDLENEEREVDRLLELNDIFQAKTDKWQQKVEALAEEINEAIRENEERNDQNNNLKQEIEKLQKQLGDEEIAENGTSEEK